MQTLRAVLTAAFMLFANGAFATTTVTSGCMTEQAGFDLNCTAKDIQIATAKNIKITDDGCAYPGDTVDFEATFEVVVTAKERFDIGLYFGIDGDAGEAVPDGAVSGVCSVSTPYDAGGSWLDLDGVNDDPDGLLQDTCGDIDKDHNPLEPVIVMTGVLCSDPDNDGKLNLPYCTSWRQSGSNGLCREPTDAYPGAPSKCNCDQTFNIDIDVPPAQLLVTKTAMPDKVTEPGGNVTYSVELKNPGIDPANSVGLTALTDDKFGDLDGEGTCSLLTPEGDTQTLSGNGGTYSCSFTKYVAGNATETHVNTVSASGIDMRGNPLSGDDDALVTFEDAAPRISVVKKVNGQDSYTMNEPGGLVTFSVSITNNSVATDPVTITSLTDDVHGNLNGMGDCGVPQTLASGGSYSCSFTALVTQDETDTITASGTDDEGTAVNGSDSAVVVVTDVPGQISIDKKVQGPDDAEPLDATSVDEPGGFVSFFFTIYNNSSVDAVRIESLDDSVYGDLGSTCSLPTGWIPAGGTHTCSFSAYVSGNATEYETNTVTAQGVDDDGQQVKAADTATVNVQNVSPAALVTKTVSEVEATFVVTVENDSSAEELMVTELIDDVFGDLNGKGSCVKYGDYYAVLGVNGEPDDTYTCTFTETIQAADLPHENTVQATVSDDEGGSVTPSDSAVVSFE